MLLIKALAAASRWLTNAHRTDGFFDRMAAELMEDPGAFWQKHRAKVVVFATSAVVSGLATVVMHRFTSPF